MDFQWGIWISDSKPEQKSISVAHKPSVTTARMAGSVLPAAHAAVVLQHYDGTAPRPWHLQEQRTFCRRFGGTATSTSKTFHISLLRVSQSLQQLDFFLKCIPFKNISLYCREDLLCPVPPSACISHSTQQNGAGSVHQESSWWCLCWNTEPGLSWDGKCNVYLESEDRFQERGRSGLKSLWKCLHKRVDLLCLILSLLRTEPREKVSSAIIIPKRNAEAVCAGQKELTVE